MTWLAVSDHDERRLSLRGLGADKQAAPRLANDPRLLVTRGTLLFETRIIDGEQPINLLGFHATQPWVRGLMFRALPDRGIELIQTLGEKTTRTKAKLNSITRADDLRITYSWDTTANWARLTLEQPQETHVSSVIVGDPAPLSLGDLRDLMLGNGNCTFSNEIIFAALSDVIEPIGPMPTLLPDVPVATPWGYKPVGEIQRGDTVNTRSSGVVPVIHRLARTVPARGSYRPIRLRAPYFGLQQDITVSPEQRVLIDGPEVEYLFGAEAVLVPARHLANGFTGYSAPCGATVTYSQLLLPRHETILAAGTPLESLFIGRIRRNSTQLKGSIFSALERSGLPEHGHPSHQVLRHFEAIHLARRRAA